MNIAQTTVALIVCALVSSAVGREIEVGTVRIIIPDPQGMVDLTDSSAPSVQVAKSVIVKPNELVALFAAETLMPYVQVQKNTEFENRQWDVAKFSQFKGYIRAAIPTAVNNENFAILMAAWKSNADQELRKHLGERIAVDVGKPLLLSAVSEGDNHLTVPVLLRLRIGEAAEPMLLYGTLTYAIFRGRLTYLYYYDKFAGPETPSKVLAATDAWLAAIMKANS